MASDEEKPCIVDDLCPVCGSKDKKHVRMKTYCAKCGALLQTCCD